MVLFGKILLDLTADVEQCATCRMELGQGSEKAAHMFVLKYCRCVSALAHLSVGILSWIGCLWALRRVYQMQDFAALSKSQSCQVRSAEVSSAV
jgi:hypothetical protein